MKLVFAFLFIFIISISALLIIVRVNDYIKRVEEGFHVQNKYTDYADYSDYQGKKATLDEKSFAAQARTLQNAMNDDYDTITDPIKDAYLPDVKETPQSYMEQKANEYSIINIYKTLLQRQPTPEELNKVLLEFQNGLDEDVLKTRIYNSREYKMIMKMQSNDVEPSLISTISTIKLIDKLKQIYKKELNRDAVKEMLLPLKDCYIHLQYNDYLFRALLTHRNYNKFEQEVLEEHLLSQKKLLYIFNKHFLLAELKTISDNIVRLDKLNKPVPQESETSIGTELAKASDTLGVGQNIDKIVSDGNNVFNINIILNEDTIKGSKPYSSANESNYAEVAYDTVDFSDDADDADDGGGADAGGAGAMKDDGKNKCDSKNKNKKRIYNPIKYKQHYRGDMRYRPNVCSYGTKQVVQPVFLESKALFQGTDLKEASENTSVGSIMPKFEYREYEEVNA